MVVTFDKPTGKTGNTGSSRGLVTYLEKENKGKELNEQERWFGHTVNEVHPSEVSYSIDKDHQGIGKDEGKFASGSINITEEEWKHLGKTEQEREHNFKQFAKEQFTKDLAENFNKKDRAGNTIEIKPTNVNIYYKLEHNRYYKGTDEEVKQKLKEQGQSKEGFNKHIHFIVARKTRDGQNRISPTTKNRKEFDRTNLIRKCEQSFDKRTGYERPLDQSFDYANTMKNGAFNEKKEYLTQQIESQLRTQQKESQLINQQRVEIEREKNIEKLQEQSREQQRSKGMNLGI